VSGFEYVLQIIWTALMHSAFGGHIECVQVLINAGAEKEASDNVRFGCSLCGRIWFASSLHDD
jgi:hypothetical protein